MCTPVIFRQENKLQGTILKLFLKYCAFNRHEEAKADPFDSARQTGWTPTKRKPILGGQDTGSAVTDHFGGPQYHLEFTRYSDTV